MRFSTAEFLLFSVLILTICANGVLAVPPLPAEYYGNVIIDGSPAPAGSTISAYLIDEMKGTIVTELPGFYGGPGLFDARLKVNVTEDEFQAGDIVIRFKINGVMADQSVLFEPGSSQQFDLSTGSGLAGQVATPGPTPVPILTEMPGTVSGTDQTLPSPGSSISYGLGSDKRFKSDDGLSEIFFEKDTLLFSPNGEFLHEVMIKARNIEDLPPITDDIPLQFTGFAYEIQPDRTYFNPEGVFSIFVPLDSAAGIISNTPRIYQYIPQTASWNHLKTTINAFTGEVSATVYEAGIYVLFVPAESAPAIGEMMTPVPMQEELPPGTSYEPSAIPPQVPGSIPVQPFHGQAVIPVETLVLPTVEPENTLVITDEEITPQTDLPGEIPNEPAGYGEEQVEPGVSPSGQKSPQVPSLPSVGGFFSSVKSKLSGPVGLGIGALALILIVNLLIYLLYTRWWLVRSDE